jgi:2-C-methyl-D-erythritol 4-phosphate cytidylyltransferase/2-C-methyl-D-erythritol 2,4-cyclodiphosphate synthase
LQKITLVLLSAGSSSRFGIKTKKQWLYQKDKPLWLKVAEDFKKSFDFKEIVIVAPQEDINYMQKFANYTFVVGGTTRQESLKNALKVVDSKWVMVSDVARCCIDKKLIKRLIKNRKRADSIIPALNAVDTLYQNNLPINREEIKIIQTPQLSRVKILKRALDSHKNYTDDSSAIKDIGGSIYFVEGSQKAHKLTYVDDLKRLSCLKAPSKEFFVGIGIDIHPFEEYKKMYLGGVEIDVDFGFKAHSDGDVAIHSLIDSLLGASSMGDIGELFPDDDESFKGIDSKILLQRVVELINHRGFEIVNVDLTIVAQKPRLKDYKKNISQTLAKILKIPLHRVNIKATTAEKMGFVGRKEGVLVQSVATLKYFDWRVLR